MKGWKTGTVRENLLRTGMGCFAYSAGLTVINVMLLPIARTYHGYSAAIMLTAFAAILGIYILLGRLLARTAEAQLERISRWLVPVCLAALFVIQVTLGYMMEYTPSGDNMMIYNGSELLAAEGSFSREPGFGLYLARFSNQWGFLLFFTVIWKIFSLFGFESIFMPMVIIQAFLYIPGILCALDAAKRVRGIRAKLMLLAMLMTCLPLYLAAGVLYTDTFSLPFVMIALNLALRVREEADTKRRLLLCVACGFVVTLGGMIKMTVAIVFIAAAIVWILTLKPVNAFSCIAVCGVMMIVGNGLVFQTMVNGPIDAQVYKQQNTPIIHWVMMSIPTSDNPYGGFSYDYAITWEMMDAGADHEEVMDSIYGRMKDKIYTLRYPNRLVMATLRKNAAAFGDGTFGMTEMLDDGPVRENAVSAIVLDSRPHYDMYQAITSGIFFAQLLMAVIACVGDIRRRELSMALGYVAAFGMMLFLMIWEARTRYFFGFVPVILLLSSLMVFKRNEENA